MHEGISLTGVSMRFGDRVALQDVSFSLQPGKLYGLLGGSGAGKTTLIRLLIGSLVPAAGRVNVLGYDAGKEFRKVRTQLGYMPQDDALYPELTALENVRFFWRGRSRKADEAEARKVLTSCGLAERIDDRVDTFSGGMRRRVSLACALVGSPPLLLLDEPTAALDPLLRHELWQLLAAAGSRGATVLVSTHQVDEAQYCKQLLILQEGRLIQQCSPTELRSFAPKASTLDEAVRVVLQAANKEAAR